MLEDCQASPRGRRGGQALPWVRTQSGQWGLGGVVQAGPVSRAHEYVQILMSFQIRRKSDHNDNNKHIVMNSAWMVFIFVCRHKVFLIFRTRSHQCASVWVQTSGDRPRPGPACPRARSRDLTPGVLWGPFWCPVNLAFPKVIQDRVTQGPCVCMCVCTFLCTRVFSKGFPDT